MKQVSWLREHARTVKKNISLKILNNKESFRFLLFFSLYSISFFIVYFLLQDSLQFVLWGTASLSGFFSNLLGMMVTVDGVNILTGNMDLAIIHECTGIFAMIITVSSILAYPTEKKKKVFGILFAIPFIFVFNLIRLLVLIYTAKFQSDIFELVHSYLWQGTFLIVIILAWFLWIELVVNHER